MCNKVLKEKSEVRSHILYPEMQQLELAKLNLTKLQEEGFPQVDPFNYPSWENFPKEEYTLSAYGEREPILREFPIRHIVSLNPNSLIFSTDPMKGRHTLMGFNLAPMKGRHTLM